jgi:hypothetical protein
MMRMLHIAILLLVSTAVLSCSMEFDSDVMESDSALKGNKILLSGIVADEDGNPLEGISIQMLEYLANDETYSAISSAASSTDSDGFYTIYADGHTESMQCYVRAEDLEKKYESQTKMVLITWSGPSFDSESGIFVINDCNFIMQKKQ